MAFKAVAVKPITTLDLKRNMAKEETIPAASIPVKSSLGSEEVFSMDDFASADTDTLLEPSVAARVGRLFAPDTPLEAAVSHVPLLSHA